MKRRTRAAGLAGILIVAAFVAACSSQTTGAGWTLGPSLAPQESAAPAAPASSGSGAPAPSPS